MLTEQMPNKSVEQRESERERGTGAGAKVNMSGGRGGKPIKNTEKSTRAENMLQRETRVTAEIQSVLK